MGHGTVAGRCTQGHCIAELAIVRAGDDAQSAVRVNREEHEVYNCVIRLSERVFSGSTAHAIASCFIRLPHESIILSRTPNKPYAIFESFKPARQKQKKKEILRSGA